MTSTMESIHAGKLSSESLISMRHRSFVKRDLNNHMYPPAINSMPNPCVGFVRRRFWNILMQKQATNSFFSSVCPVTECTCTSSGGQPKNCLKNLSS
ncbi:hypothetical protein C8R48DRAFT_683144, partial [Suillus tomentosus]